MYIGNNYGTLKYRAFIFRANLILALDFELQEKGLSYYTCVLR